MQEESVVLSSGARARVYRGSPEARVGVIILHPWGPVGGSIHDPHVVTVTRIFGKAGAATARVTFRTGFSFGSSPILDVKGAADELLKMSNIERLLIVGYSYGSIVAQSAPSELPNDVSLGWISIAPPLDVLWALFLFNGKTFLNKALLSNVPKLLIHPTNDQFCSTASFDSFFSNLPESKTQVKIKDAHHFDLAPVLPEIIPKWIQSTFDVDDLQAFVSGHFSSFSTNPNSTSHLSSSS
mmetsp:Transcript_17676/g.26552  ORF Transcript_17676/g.26552 Transcript_17676/m.26552 type:complete len:240 (+) Transcript_17676:53-772(+)